MSTLSRREKTEETAAPPLAVESKAV